MEKTFDRNYFIENFGYVPVKLLTIDEKKDLKTCKARIVSEKLYGKDTKSVQVKFNELLILKFNIGTLRRDSETGRIKGIQRVINESSITYLEFINNNSIFDVKYRIFEQKNKKGKLYYSYEIIFADDDNNMIYRQGNFDGGENMILTKLKNDKKFTPIKVKDYVDVAETSSDSAEGEDYDL